MRLRNVRGAREKIAADEYTVQEPKDTALQTWACCTTGHTPEKV